MIKLITKRLLIRDPVLEDLMEHHNLFSSEIAMRYWQSSKTNSIEESREQLMKSIEEVDSKDRNLYFLKIFDKKMNILEKLVIQLLKKHHLEKLLVWVMP